MATAINVKGKITQIPGIYTRIKSGVKTPTVLTSYGNACIIDIGLGAGFCGGAGISGASKSGSESVLEFSSIEDFRAVARGGAYWSLAEKLFSPASGSNGVSKLFFVKAATTTQATATATLGASIITFKTKDEGTCANGILDTTTSELIKGYGIKITSSPYYLGSYVLSFYIGLFKGIDSQGGAIGDVPYDGVSQQETKSFLLFDSPAFSNLGELKSWALTDSSFNSMFELNIPSNAVLTTAVSGSEFTSFGTGFKLLSGATETYSQTDYDKVLDEIVDLDNTFFLAPDSGVSAASLYNTKLFYHIQNQTRFDKFMVVAAGTTKNDFKGSSTGSVEIAKFYDSDKVLVVHGGSKELSNSSPNLVNRSSLYLACQILGRVAGLEPQIPLTFKKINIAGLQHNLSRDEQEQAIKSGLLYIIKDSELGFIVGAGINSLQRNNFIVNSDASSYSISVKRIVAQLNKELVINAKLVFFGNDRGANRGTFSEKDIEVWMYGYLSSKVSTNFQDNLIISFGNIKASFTGDTCEVTYEFVPNFEIQKMIITGVLLEK